LIVNSGREFSSRNYSVVVAARRWWAGIDWSWGLQDVVIIDD
jgi:hypothetical protein